METFLPNFSQPNEDQKQKFIYLTKSTAKKIVAKTTEFFESKSIVHGD